MMAMLLGSNLSPFVRKTLLYILEAGLEGERDNDITPMNGKDLLLAINPRGTMPAFADNKVKLGESSVICAYLERKYGFSGLYPRDAAKFGMALWYEKWAEEELIPVIGPIFFNRDVAPMMGQEGMDCLITNG
ncbi:MAG: glutathione S-transferase family protein [Pseudomonadales bacterium]